jgi:hypothetical protein
VAPGPVLTPLQPASRPSEQMDDWEVNKLPLWGRAGMPSELAASYVSVMRCMHAIGGKPSSLLVLEADLT